jgi:NodT family efflux transporter outer membrane factor (OMF) lipoprotein
MRNRLAALVGRLPSQGIAETFDLDSLHLPQDLPVSVASQLVEQRPDIRVVEAQLHAASAGVGVAIANQLPQFSITAAVGGTATGFANLPGAGVWNITAGAAQTLFDAGTLLHKKRAAVDAFDQAAAQYRSTVIKAFQNVSDALRALQADADDLVAQDAAERSAFASLELARRQFHADTIDYVTVLIAERTWQLVRINRIQAEANRYADTAALFQALGGGWWHRSDVNPSGHAS